MQVHSRIPDGSKCDPLPEFWSAMFHTLTGLAERQNLKQTNKKKGGKSVVWYPLTSLPPSYPALSEAECEASTGGQEGWHQTFSKMKGPLEVHNSESKPCVQHVSRTNVCPGG